MNQILPPTKSIPFYNLFLNPHFEDEHLVTIRFSEESQALENKGSIIEPLFQFNTDIEKYLKNKNHKFNTPCDLKGTKFQKAVWQYLLQIPVGQVCTYGDVSNVVGGAAIAVGQALKHNPIPIIYPCHRVVSKKDIGGYAGQTNGYLMDFKKILLKHEGYNNVNN